ncbi:hypothetical protein [Nonomuraea sp. 10N515B]|uniref:hypothetical protein n=1 Tax=Nonomuraea sp. 10N515B TaxID=3457422 RepID=UPI003FCD2CE3
MSDMPERSLEPISADALDRLSDLAAKDRDKFFRKRPEYAARLLCVALCQGAGLHFVHLAQGKANPNGIKDFDVWSFFAAVPNQRFPADRRYVPIDFGPSVYGRWTREPERFRHYLGRRVDLFVRALPVSIDADPVGAVREYLSAGRTQSARLLAAKGVVLIDPAGRRGEIVWPC